jgi:hypothetical protein
MLQKVLALIITLLPLLAAAQDTEIYLFKLSVNDTNVVLTQPLNISNHKGYDNQPHFHPTQPLLYFAANNEQKKSDIKQYSLQTGALTNITQTGESEYSPTVTPDQAYLSCILLRDDKVQDLIRYPIDGGTPSPLVNTLKVGYHVWINEHQLLLFVLKDSVTNELHHYDLRTKEDKVIAKAPGRSLHKIPGRAAMSFIEKTSADQYTLKKLDIASGAITTITALPPKDDIAWTRNGLVLLSNGNSIRVYNPKRNRWTSAVIEGDGTLMKNISRMAINPANDLIAVVAAE